MKTVQKESGRIAAIDILKFFAALLITNSHMEILYPDKLSFLASGGGIGDTLFFFCSGFTLFMKPMNGIKQFPNWYKRRISRIYPTVFAAAIIGCLFFDRHPDIIGIIFRCGWFITCIMVYYVVIYFVGSYFKDKIYLVSAIVLVATGVWFFLEYQKPDFYMFNLEGSRICLLYFFVFMLMGAKMGQEAERIGNKPILDLLLLIVSVISYYIIIFVGIKLKGMSFIHYFSLIPLITTVYYFYRVCNSKWAEKLYYNKTLNLIVRVIGGLCLEIYLVQGMVISVTSNSLNSIFPLNILIVFIGIFLLGYLTRCLARFLSQTFNESPYNWKKIIEKY